MYLFKSQTREEIIDKGQEEGFILIYQLGQVHVPQHPHDDGRLGVLGVVSLGRAQGSKNGQNVSKTKIVVNLEWVKTGLKRTFINRQSWVKIAFSNFTLSSPFR